MGDLIDDKLTGDLGNVIETTQIGGRRSAVVGRIVLRRENYHRAILDFYNNICHKPTFAPDPNAWPKI